MTKSCIVQTTAANAKILQRHLPAGVEVWGSLEYADKDQVNLRLAGEGLPDWCYVAQGAYLPHAVAELLEGGVLRLIPGSGIPVEQIHPSLQEKPIE